MMFLINIWMIQRGFTATFMLTEAGGGVQLQRDDSTLATGMAKTGTITNKITRNALNRLQRVYKNGRSLIIQYALLHGLSSSTSFSKQGKKNTGVGENKAQAQKTQKRLLQETKVRP
jgi:hypothetical protein